MQSTKEGHSSKGAGSNIGTALCTLNAEKDNILVKLKELKEKVKISLVMPQIFENPLTVQQCLRKTPYRGTSEMLLAYLKNLPKSETTGVNSQLIHLIGCIHENHGMLDYLPNWLDGLSEDDNYLLKAMDLLYAVADQHFHRSAADEIDKEYDVINTFQEIENVLRAVDEKQRKIRNQKIKLQSKYASRENELNKYATDLATTKTVYKYMINNQIVQSSESIRKLQASGAAALKDLDEQLAKSVDVYGNTIKSHLTKEKETRLERQKLLHQLQALVQKYDQTMLDRVKESQRLDELYEETKKKLTEFTVNVFQPEEQNYITEVAEKEEKENRSRQAKILLFTQTRAARVIQRAYRVFKGWVLKRKRRKGKRKQEDLMPFDISQLIN